MGFPAGTTAASPGPSRSPSSVTRRAPRVTVKISAWVSVCDWSDTYRGSTVIRHVHTLVDPRLGAANPVNSTPGTAKRGACAALLTVMRSSEIDKLACPSWLVYHDRMASSGQPLD